MLSLLSLASGAERGKNQPTLKSAAHITVALEPDALGMEVVSSHQGSIVRRKVVVLVASAGLLRF